jgi:hypothetical protein
MILYSVHLQAGRLEKDKIGSRLKSPGWAASGYLLGEHHGSMPVMHTHHHTHKQGDEKHWINKFLQPGLHKDWRTWVVIALMLAAIGIYVATLDDSVQSGNVPQQGVPAAAAPR